MHQAGRHFLILSRDDSDESAPDPPPDLIDNKQCKHRSAAVNTAVTMGLSSHMFPCPEVEVSSSLLHLLHLLRLRHVQSIVQDS